MKIHHFGFFCTDIEKAILFFCDLGLVMKFRIIDELRKVELAFLDDQFGAMIELVAPASSDSIISSLIKKNPNSFYHACFIAERFDSEINHLEEKGFLLIHPPQESVAFNMNRVTFLFHKELGIIELVEKKNESCLFK